MYVMCLIFRGTPIQCSGAPVLRCVNTELRDPVSGHASVVLAVAPGGPDEQSGGHHLQRGGDQGQV